MEKNWISTVSKIKKDVFQCLSNTNINIADPSTGVITANALNINNTVILTKGNNILLFLNPGIDRVLLVDNKFTKEIVVLIPA